MRSEDNVSLTVPRTRPFARIESIMPFSAPDEDAVGCIKINVPASTFAPILFTMEAELGFLQSTVSSVQRTVCNPMLEAMSTVF